MKYLFILMLLVVGAAAGAWGAAIVVRWNDNMTQTARIMPGERATSSPTGLFSMPPGVVSRGGALIIPKEQRDVAAKQPNPVKTSDVSVAIGKERYATFCSPCHGPEGKGGTSGLVATKFIPTPDLTNAELQKQRTDGYWHSYIVVGGAVMPAYGEALSTQEAWHIVNFLRSIAQK
jgi:mono/diheme cytochrome c family protein